MPTVHLSLPEDTYAQLRRKANELGIQVTDLIKFYIRLGLERGFLSSGPDNSSEALATLSRKIDRLEKEFKIKTVLLEGKYRQVEETINYLIERIEMLEELMSQARVLKIISEGKVEES